MAGVATESGPKKKGAGWPPWEDDPNRETGYVAGYSSALKLMLSAWGARPIRRISAQTFL